MAQTQPMTQARAYDFEGLDCGSLSIGSTMIPLLRTFLNSSVSGWNTRTIPKNSLRGFGKYHSFARVLTNIALRSSRDCPCDARSAHPHRS
jgi:hypothetical protein